MMKVLMSVLMSIQLQYTSKYTQGATTEAELLVVFLDQPLGQSWIQ